nr:DUF1156 domain-containing protein [Desulfoglaeba alkanexedens]
MNGKKILIETALPLDAVNRESAREKSIRHGHPSTLHLWWARRPLAACRAVLFAQLVDDPSAHPDKFPTQEDQRWERERIFGIMEDLVKWENINIGVALLVSRDAQLPLFYREYEGNRHDSKQFNMILTEMIARMNESSGNEEGGLTLVFDKGMNSEENIALIDSTARVHFITTYSPCCERTCEPPLRTLTN